MTKTKAAPKATKRTDAVVKALNQQAATIASNGHVRHQKPGAKGTRMNAVMEAKPKAETALKVVKAAKVEPVKSGLTAKDLPVGTEVKYIGGLSFHLKKNPDGITGTVTGQIADHAVRINWADGTKGGCTTNALEITKKAPAAAK